MRAVAVKQAQFITLPPPCLIAGDVCTGILCLVCPNMVLCIVAKHLHCGFIYLTNVPKIFGVFKCNFANLNHAATFIFLKGEAFSWEPIQATLLQSFSNYTLKKYNI